MPALLERLRLRRHAARLDAAAAAIAAADGLLIGAGAGMSVESGLAPYRGPDGQWVSDGWDEEGFSPQARASAAVFAFHPASTAAHHGQRWAQALAATPHAGYQHLLGLAAGRPAGAFVFTSNVDTLFARAGFDPARVYECHGSLARSQCPRCPGAPVFPSPTDGTAATCPRCRAWARPNVLMFDDTAYNPVVRTEQWDAWGAWLRERSGAKLVVLEVGAGIDITSVRNRSESLAAAGSRPLIRVNPAEPALPDGTAGVALPLTAGVALRELAARLS